MSPLTVSDDRIVQEVIIKAPAARIFVALTRPDELLKWWVSEGNFHVVKAECDLQPGGKWRMHVVGSCGPDATSSTVYGEYRVIDPPRLLTYTWLREHEDYPETLVRWDLEEKDGYTTVRVTHSGLVSESLRSRNSGWPLIVELLQAYIREAHARPSPPAAKTTVGVSRRRFSQVDFPTRKIHPENCLRELQ